MHQKARFAMSLPTRRACGGLVLVGLAIAAVLPLGAARSENPQIATRRAHERKTFSDAEIAKGFFLTAFGAEYRVSGASDRIRKFDGPVRVMVEPPEPPGRTAELPSIVADIGSRIQHIDIGMARSRSEANLIVTLSRDRDLGSNIARLFGGRKSAARSRRPSIPNVSPASARTDEYRIVVTRGAAGH